MSMLAHRLTRLIEAHADQLVASLEARILKSERCNGYRNVNSVELRRLVTGIYSHLGQWLVSKTEKDIQERYTHIGQLRAEEGISVAQLLWCIVLVKENLWEYLRENENHDTTAQIFGELVLTQMVDQFFDHAIYYAVRGHESAREARLAS
jgi:hypothetical protein